MIAVMLLISGAAMWM
ncbi:hypothetical protein F9B82_10450 [Lacticaseibacillus casei]|nr:hypothetical protein F9B82_10450 [Lacticaseibacillus casei]